MSTSRPETLREAFTRHLMVTGRKPRTVEAYDEVLWPFCEKSALLALQSCVNTIIFILAIVRLFLLAHPITVSTGLSHTSD